MTCPPVGATEWEGLGATRTMIGMARTYPFTGIWNMTGQPAISVPGPPADGLPIGAQLIGPPDSEPLLLSVAGQLEQELRWPELVTMEEMNVPAVSQMLRMMAHSARKFATAPAVWEWQEIK